MKYEVIATGVVGIYIDKVDDVILLALDNNSRRMFPKDQLRRIFEVGDEVLISGVFKITEANEVPHRYRVRSSNSLDSHTFHGSMLIHRPRGYHVNSNYHS